MEIVKQIIYLLVGLVVFVTGMKLMSDGLKTCAGRSIRRLFKKIKNNRIASAAVGAGTTAIIQSSGATTVLVVGFLSAGALTFSQGFSVMLGAFLGTTVTGLLVALSSFSFSMFLMLLAFVGFVLGFFKNENVKSVGEILIGFGILFFGLEAMKGAFAIASIQEALVNLLSSMNFPLLLMIFGALLTALTQSSSATNGIVIVMVLSNPKLLSSGFYLVIGATIGAMLPTFLASINSNSLAKRVTYSAIVTRTIGAVIATLIIWAISTPLFNFLEEFPSENVGMILAIFTVIYNFLFLVIFLPITPLVEKVANKIFKDKDAERKKKVLHHIDDHLLNTPAIAIIQVKKEIENMFELAKINFALGMDAIINQDLSNAKEIESREDDIDYFNEEISQYLIKLSPKANMHDEKKIGSYYHVINDIERIGDHANNFLQMAKQMVGLDLKFSEIAVKEFKIYEVVLKEMFEVSGDIFHKRTMIKLDELHLLEEKTDDLREQYEKNHFERLKNNECINELSPFHSNLLSELERVADHLTNIGYSIVSPTGDENDYLNANDNN